MRTVPFLALLLASSSLVHHVQYNVDALPSSLEYWKQLLPAHQDINLDNRPTVRIIKRNSLPVLKRRSLRERAPPANEPKAEDKTPENKAPDNKDKAPENKAPDNKDKAPENKDKAPENKDKAPENKDKAPENKDKAPDNKGDNKDAPHKDQKEGNTPKGNTPTNASSPSESVTAAASASSNSGAATAVPTGSLSPGAIAGLSIVGGLFALVGAFFAFMRRKKHQEHTSAIVAKSAAAFEQQSSAYEKMDDSTQPLGTYTVVDTHIPHLDDELELQPGEQVTVLVEYDDGWVQGINESNGVKGVFPRHCVDMSNNDFDGKIDKRTSSIHGGYQSINLH